MGAALRAFVRKKDVYSNECQQTSLPRVLNIFDLTFLGIGSTLGAGVYVVTGEIAKTTAGPGVILSFLFAAIASVLCGLCYAEFAARVPKAGSAYIYSYVTMGELCAFVIGWNLLLEYLIGAAAVARAWSSYLNSLVNGLIGHELELHVGHMHTPGISSYPDFLAFSLCLVAACVVAFGVRTSTRFNVLMSVVNIGVILFITVLGIVYGKLSNWKAFLPFGFSGTLQGAATAFFAFVGFDIIAITGEEAKKPARTIPAAIVISLAICFVGYAGVATSLTLLEKYDELASDAALPIAFERQGVTWAKYVIASGALAGLTSSLIGSVFPVPRLLYAMAIDGLIFPPFGWVNSFTKTPIFSTILPGIIAGVLAIFFELSSLVEMMSIGTLQAYTMVAVCVLLLRYRQGMVALVETDTGLAALSDESVVDARQGKITATPTSRSGQLVFMAVTTLFFSEFGLSALLIYGGHLLLKLHFWLVVIFFALLGACVVAVTVIVLQPQNKNDLPFKAPGVPVLPLVSMFVNIYLMMELSSLTWVRFGLWMFLGLTVYLLYGVQHSRESPELKTNTPTTQQVPSKN